MKIGRIDHIEVRSTNPEKTAKVLAGIFGGVASPFPGCIWEVHFEDTATFFEVKPGNPTTASECNRALSRVAIVVDNTEAVLAEVRKLDPEAKDLGCVGEKKDRRIVEFTAEGILFHTIQREK